MNQTLVGAHERLTLAQQELATAQAKADKERRDLLAGQLAQVREDLRTARVTHDALVKRLHAEREALDNMQAKVNATIERIADSMRLRPAASDYLPDDPEVVAWQKAHEALEGKRDRLIAERGKLANPDLTVGECNKYEGPAGLIVELTYAEQNLLRALQGPSGNVRDSGVISAVGGGGISSYKP